MSETFLCDWTWRQGVVPAETIESEGFGGVWLKAGGAQVGDAENGWRERFIDPTFLEGASRLAVTSLVRGAYWYLMPGRVAAQMGLFYDVLLEASRSRRGMLAGWAPKLDVEQAGLEYADVAAAVGYWRHLSDDYPLTIYTNRNLWNATLPIAQRDRAGDTSGVRLSPLLEDAHWVSEAVRTNPAKPYASQHARAIAPDWWNLAWGDGQLKRYGYGGWDAATVMQFTNNALIAGKRQMASVFRGSKEEFRSRFTRG